jgi:hypothetical protein
LQPLRLPAHDLEHDAHERQRGPQPVPRDDEVGLAVAAERGNVGGGDDCLAERRGEGCRQGGRSASAGCGDPARVLLELPGGVAELGLGRVAVDPGVDGCEAGVRPLELD